MGEHSRRCPDAFTYRSPGTASWTGAKGRTWRTSPLASEFQPRRRFSAETEQTSFCPLLPLPVTVTPFFVQLPFQRRFKAKVRRHAQKHFDQTSWRVDCVSPPLLMLTTCCVSSDHNCTSRSDVSVCVSGQGGVRDWHVSCSQWAGGLAWLWAVQNPLSLLVPDHVRKQLNGLLQRPLQTHFRKCTFLNICSLNLSLLLKPRRKKMQWN